MFGKVVCDANEMEKWQEKPFNLLKSLCGCTEQCPFCGEQCDLGEHAGTEIKHRVAQHRPNCLAGYSDDTTQELVIDICPTKVASEHSYKDTDQEWHPFKEYMKIYPNWHVPPDLAAEDSTYWKWFIGQYMMIWRRNLMQRHPKCPRNGKR